MAANDNNTTISVTLYNYSVPASFQQFVTASTSQSEHSIFTHIVWGGDPYTDWEAAFIAMIKVGAFGLCASNDELLTNPTRLGEFMGTNP